MPPALHSLTPSHAPVGDSELLPAVAVVMLADRAGQDAAQALSEHYAIGYEESVARVRLVRIYLTQQEHKNG